MQIYFGHISNTMFTWFTRARTPNVIKVKLNGPLSNHLITARGIPGGHQDLESSKNMLSNTCLGSLQLIWRPGFTASVCSMLQKFYLMNTVLHCLSDLLQNLSLATHATF